MHHASLEGHLISCYQAVFLQYLANVFFSRAKYNLKSTLQVYKDRKVYLYRAAHNGRYIVL